MEKTAVVFRVWRDTNTVIALFPNEREVSGCVMSYEHVGQHGAADYAHVINATRPANADESSALRQELQGIGYNLVVYRRRPTRSAEAR